MGLRDRLMEIDSLFPRRPQLRPWRRRPTQRAGAVRWAIGALSRSSGRPAGRQTLTIAIWSCIPSSPCIRFL